MRIVLIGQAAFGAKVFETLLENGERIIAAYAPPDQPGGRPDPLKQAALDKGIPVIQPATYKNDQVFAEYQALNPELTVMAFVTDIIPERFFSVPVHGTINYHPSLLPRHRGASAINWAVMMGDAKTGLTIFRPDGGIDTGPILLQKEIDIQPGDTTGSLYFNHLFPMGVAAIMESIALIKKGAAPAIVQDESLATYEPPCDDRVAGIDWQKPAKTVYDLVRGCDPQPGAYVVHQGETIRFYGPRFVAAPCDQAPGTIVQIDDQGIHVALSGATLIVGKVKGAGKKLSGAEYAAAQGLKVGDVIGV